MTSSIARICRSCRPLAVGGILSVFAAGPAVAADWSVNPRVTGSFEYNDNTRMSVESANAVEATGAAVDAALELRADSPRGFVSINPRVRSTFYPDEKTEETDSYWLRTNSRYAGEVSRFDLRADFWSIETLGAYLPDGIGDPGGPIGEPDPGAGTGGRLEAPNREDRFLVAPTFRYDFSERHGMELGAGYVETKFDERVEADRENFEYVYGSAGYVYLLSPAKSLAFDANIGQFDDDSGVTTYSRGASVEWRNQVSETSEVYANAGVDQSYIDDTPLDESWETGFSGGIGVRWAFEISNVLLDVSSGLDPSASGRLLQRDTLRFQYERSLSPRTEFVTGARLFRDHEVESDDVFEEREYANAVIGLRWRFAREWTLGGAYTYVWSDFENNPSSASANRVNIGVTWEPNQP